MPGISFPLEEYLEALWALQVEGGKKAVRTGELSAYLKIKPASVTEVLGKLASQGIVTYKKYHGAALTEKGLEEAKRAIRRHRLAECLLAGVVGIPKEDVEDAACGLEHHLKGGLAERVCTLLKHPKACPHGRKIPQGECCKRALAPENDK